MLTSLPKLTFDLTKDFYVDLRKLLEEVKVTLKMQELKDLEFGSYFGVDIYNLYFKILKIMSDIHYDIQDFNAK